jgi:hypothetical protein
MSYEKIGIITEMCFADRKGVIGRSRLQSEKEAEACRKDWSQDKWVKDDGIIVHSYPVYRETS